MTIIDLFFQDMKLLEVYGISFLVDSTNLCFLGESLSVFSCFLSSVRNCSYYWQYIYFNSVSYIL